MTTTETSFVEATRRSQKAFLQVWMDTMYRFYSLLPTLDGTAPTTADAKAPTVPSAEEVVDHAFDYAEAVLEVQRAYAKSMLAASKSIANNTTWMAQGADKAATSKKS